MHFSYWLALFSQQARSCVSRSGLRRCYTVTALPCKPFQSFSSSFFFFIAKYSRAWERLVEVTFTAGRCWPEGRPPVRVMHPPPHTMYRPCSVVVLRLTINPLLLQLIISLPARRDRTDYWTGTQVVHILFRHWLTQLLSPDNKSRCWSSFNGPKAMISQTLSIGLRRPFLEEECHCESQWGLIECGLSCQCFVWCETGSCTLTRSGSVDPIRVGRRIPLQWVSGSYKGLGVPFQWWDSCHWYRCGMWKLMRG